MYLWKVDYVASDLRNGQVTQNEEFKYILAFSLIGILGTVMAAAGASAVPGWLRAVDLAIMIGITVAGVFYCYYRNQASDNQDFLRRFLCLSVPVAVRILILALVVGFIAGLVAGIVAGSEGGQQSGESSQARMFMELGVNYLVQVVLYLYLAHWIAATGRSADQPAS
ncbi:hypothetical protein ACMDCT_07615 [Halomonadaceae bacterium KBTZ08]